MNADSIVRFWISDKLFMLMMIATFALLTAELTLMAKLFKSANKIANGSIQVVALSLVYYCVGSFFVLRELFNDVATQTAATAILKEEIRPLFLPDPLLLSTWGIVALVSAVGPAFVVVLTLTRKEPRTNQ